MSTTAATPDVLTPAATDALAYSAKIKKWDRKSWVRRGPLLPALIFMIAVTQLPFIATLVISFLQWTTNAGDPKASFTGFDNFKAVFTNDEYRSAVVASVEITVTVVLISVLIGLGVALLLDRKFFGRGIVRTIMIAPFLIVPLAAALFWSNGMFSPTTGGLIPGLLGDLHVPGASSFAFLTSLPKMAIEIELIWQWTPFMMLILLAGLQSRDGEIMEAASVDGANPWQMFRAITLPHIRRYIELGATLGTIFIVQNIDAEVGMFGNGQRGAINVPFEVYQVFNQNHDYGGASALGVVVVIASIIIATFALRVVSSLLSEENA